MSASRRHRPGLLAPASSGAPVWPPAVPDPATSPLHEPGGGDRAGSTIPLLESLARLADLRDRGLLTDAEFAAATAYLLQ
ncbi:SHOCT domain-containing protein [Arthrobacter sp. B0490]|uniref:SHOCT domain-containing protein n=1 Tax=Arthrobacter sp. B0490 TaxID=2058891 RepID=UPI000CE4EB03|nr:SHOCT domain-containing protein [Arthrobacter sp. B0490]